MTSRSPVDVRKTGEKRWEVVMNDDDQTRLGTFYDVTSLDIFLEAVRHLCQSNVGRLPSQQRLVA